jgi:hypothetical protein
MAEKWHFRLETLINYTINQIITIVFKEEVNVFRKKLAKIAKIGDHNNNSCLDKQTKIFELF